MGETERVGESERAGETERVSESERAGETERVGKNAYPYLLGSYKSERRHHAVCDVMKLANSCSPFGTVPVCTHMQYTHTCSTHTHAVHTHAAHTHSTHIYIYI